MTTNMAIEHMSAPPARFQDSHLGEAIERQIQRRTGGQVDHLQVTVSNGRVILNGSTSSCYVRELALLATLEALGSHNPKLVDMYVELDA